MALKVANGGVAWTDWDPTIEAESGRGRVPEVAAVRVHAPVVCDQGYANERGIRIMGDVPIFVAQDSADVWAQPELFRSTPTDRRSRACRPTTSARPASSGATRSTAGTRMAADGYAWWIARMRAALELVDLVRIDHFRGFEAYWEVPGDRRPPTNGRWVKGPGARALRRAREGAGATLPIVAENLGVITPEVEAIRERFGFPGMAILQFAFGKDPQAPTFLPHNYPRESSSSTPARTTTTPPSAGGRGEGGDSTRTAGRSRPNGECARATSAPTARRCTGT